tara:strand:- start:277 stop:903 length:627 start_codon:yes stop_codon:yes gene_type:complete
MADVNDMFNDITKEQSFYTPKAKKDITPIVEGDYLCHITDVKTEIKDVKGKYRARLYSYTVEVAPENKDMDYEYQDIDGSKKPTKGHVYVGKRFYGRVWRFLEPSEGDSFESNSQGNTHYLRFCETIGLDCPKETKNINGQDIEVQILPSLSSEDMLGQPVTSFVALGNPFTNKKGERKQYFDCKFCKKWEGGKKINIGGGKKDDIPF